MYSRLASLFFSLSEFKNRDQGHHVCCKRGKDVGGMSGVGEGVEDRAVFLASFFHADKIVDVVMIEGRKEKKRNTCSTR